MNSLDNATGIRELFDRHTPLLLSLARHLGIASEERREVVTTLLDDVVMSMIERPIVLNDMTAYLTTALRNRVRNTHRDRTRSDATKERAYTRLVADERVVAEALSQFGLSAAYPLDPVERESRPEIARLSAWLETQLSRMEMALLAGEPVAPSRNAARVRLSRLRARIRPMIPAYVATLNGCERMEVRRFLRRAGVPT